MVTLKFAIFPVEYSTEVLPKYVHTFSTCHDHTARNISRWADKPFASQDAVLFFRRGARDLTESDDRQQVSQGRVNI
jgi:hypothetical protein